MFKEMLFIDTLRGEDSTGVYCIDKYGNVQWIKSAQEGRDFLREKDFVDFMQHNYIHGMALVGHNRKSTKGATTDENAHPFVEKNIIMVHNGTIRNQTSLNKDVEVDSHAICHCLAEHGVKEGLSKVDGAYAIVAYDIDTKTIHLARNSERPLWIGETDDIIMFASEPWMMFGPASRQGIRLTMKELPELNMYNFTIQENMNKDIITSSNKIEKFVWKSSLVVVPDDAASNDYFWPGDTTSYLPKQETKIVSALLKKVFPNNDMFTSGDIINFTPKSFSNIYKDNFVIGYNIIGTHYNNPEVVVKAICTGVDWNEMQLLMAQQILIADVQTVVIDTNNVYTLMVHGVCSSTPYVSVNGIIITEEMVLKLPNCIQCKEEIDEDSIEDSFVVVKQGKIHHTFCPNCVVENTAKNPKWGKLNETQRQEAAV